MLLDPEVFRQTIIVFGKLSKKDELQRDFNLLDDLLKIADKYLDFGITFHDEKIYYP